MKIVTALRRGTFVALGAAALLCLPALLTGRPVFAALGSFTHSAAQMGLSSRHAARPIDAIDPREEFLGRQEESLSVAELPRRTMRRPIDAIDPTKDETESATESGEPKVGASADSLPRPLHRSIDLIDLGREKDAPSNVASDRALRTAIKAAIDAGELERAGALLQILRTSSR